MLQRLSEAFPPERTVRLKPETSAAARTGTHHYLHAHLVTDVHDLNASIIVNKRLQCNCPVCPAGQDHAALLNKQMLERENDLVISMTVLSREILASFTEVPLAPSSLRYRLSCQSKTTERTLSRSTFCAAGTILFPPNGQVFHTRTFKAPDQMKPQ